MFNIRLFSQLHGAFWSTHHINFIRVEGAHFNTRKVPESATLILNFREVDYENLAQVISLATRLARAYRYRRMGVATAMTAHREWLLRNGFRMNDQGRLLIDLRPPSRKDDPRGSLH